MLAVFALAIMQSACSFSSFPEAEGGGATAWGGRGGAVYLVTNTDDSGTGSLRACIEAKGPRNCIFRTGGTIALQRSLVVANPFLTIAGQTAPGDGIQITGPGPSGGDAVVISTHDVVIRYLRIRRGHNDGETCTANCGANITILSTLPSHDPHHIVLDHVSAQWATHETLILLGGGTATAFPRSVTVSYSILGESLAGAGQTTLVAASGFSGQGSVAPDGMTDIDFHHNLFAGGSHRFPLLAVQSARIVNNFIYGWTYYATRNKGFRDFISNYFQLPAGEGPPSHEIQAWIEDAGNDTSFAPSFYVAGNAGPSDPDGTANWAMTALAESQSAGEASNPLPISYQRTAPIPASSRYIPITADPVAFVAGPMLNPARIAPFDGVGASRKLSCTGAWLDARDPVDTRIVNAVTSGTALFGSYTYANLASSPQSQNDLGGWPALAAGTPCADANSNGLPDVWESYWAGIFGLGNTLNPSGMNFADGYTNLEHFIDGMSPLP